jgi:HEAT repeat protein
VRLLPRRRPRVDRLARRRKVDKLVEALSYEDPLIDRNGQRVDLGVDVRVAAVAALAEFDGDVAEAALLRALGDPDPAVRTAAARALPRRDPNRATEALLKAAAGWKQPSLSTARSQAISALTHLDVLPSAAMYAQSALDAPGEPDEVDAAFLRRLARSDDEDGLHSALDLLFRRLGEEDVAPRAGQLLVRLAPESVLTLIEAVNDPARSAIAASFLGVTRDSRAVYPLSELLGNSGDPSSRRAAARALGEIQDPAAAEQLLVATEDPDFYVRREAQLAFNRLGNVGIAAVLGTMIRGRLPGNADPSRAPVRVVQPPQDSLATRRVSSGEPPRREGPIARLLKRSHIDPPTPL